MATIIKKGDGWQAQIAKRGIRKAQTFATKGAAKAWATQMEAEIMAGFRGDNTGKRLIDAIERYESELLPSRKGYKQEACRLGKIKAHRIASYYLTELSPQVLAQYRDERLKQVSASTYNREHGILSSLLEHAKTDWYWIKQNPAKAIRKPANSKHRERVFSQDEIDRLCTFFKWSWIEPPTLAKQIVAGAFLFSLETGMRRGEMLGLEWDRVFVDRRFVTLDTTKNEDARDVPLSPTAVKIIELMRGRKRPFDISLDACGTRFYEATRALGIENARFHDARATALTRLSRIYGVVELARIIGHRDPRSLMIYYRETAESLADKMWQDAPARFPDRPALKLVK
jgi:integrase